MGPKGVKIYTSFRVLFYTSFRKGDKMTVSNIISQVEKQRGRGALNLEEYLWHINILEEEIYRNILSLYEGAPELICHTGEDEELLGDENYCELYKFYLMAKIDLENGDITRYSNNMILYNTLLDEYADYISRTRRFQKDTRIGGY